MLALLRLITVVALIYAGWIIFRVVDDWLGLIPAMLAVLLLPISFPLLAILMLFIPTSAAGPWALLPAVAAIGLLDWIARKHGGSLLLR